MLFVGDDWAEDHHDIELMDASGRRLARARLPEGVAGMARLHALIGEQLGEDADETAEQVVIGIETDKGPWVQALIAAGYRVCAVNPLQASRYRERYGMSGAKSDGADAHMLADMVRTDSHQLRPVAGDSAEAAAIKVVSRAHKSMIWERTRHMQRLRHALRDYFPAALEAFEELTTPDALELLAKAPDPASAAKLTLTQIRTALKRARRRGDIDTKAGKIQAALRAEHLGQPAVVAQAYATTIRAATAVLATLNEQIKTLQGQVEQHFGQHPDAEIVLSQPGLGPILGARVLAEFGDDQHRYTSAKARKNYAGTSPITRASGKKKVVAARYVHNDRLIDALLSQVVPAMTASPGARALYDELRARGTDHFAACRHVANRLVGILHGCLKTRTLYNEETAWAHRSAKPEEAAVAA
ncbi:IS110 family transposase [Actinopolymorpha pittospori]|uniref:Transposase n=2 Tax=Actinopolymorpha pittospori TaxID=648752 RepID=A0A927MZZ3_9ACTN|nr:IS110 family transposase [Actinopolymorpha pittospori]MBE1610085.1 transposase [Actinopolymorpha pittospori]